MTRCKRQSGDAVRGQGRACTRRGFVLCAVRVWRSSPDRGGPADGAVGAGQVGCHTDGGRHRRALMTPCGQQEDCSVVSKGRARGSWPRPTEFTGRDRHRKA